MKIIKLLTVFVMMGCSTMGAQILSPAEWQVKMSKDFVSQGDDLELVFIIKLDTNWHLYGNVQNYDLGPIPTSFMFEPDSGYILLGSIRAIGIQSEYDDVFEVQVNYFENQAEFRQKIKILSENPVIKGVCEYQVCSMVDGKCVFGMEDFEFKINIKNQ